MDSIIIFINNKESRIDISKIKYDDFLPFINYKFNLTNNIDDPIVYDRDEDIFEKFILPIAYNSVFDINSITGENISYIIEDLKYFGLESIFNENYKDTYYHNILKKIVSNFNKKIKYDDCSKGVLSEPQIIDFSYEYGSYFCSPVVADYNLCVIISSRDISTRSIAYANFMLVDVVKKINEKIIFDNNLKIIYEDNTFIATSKNKKGFSIKDICDEIASVILLNSRLPEFVTMQIFDIDEMVENVENPDDMILYWWSLAKMKITGNIVSDIEIKNKGGRFDNLDIKGIWE